MKILSSAGGYFYINNLAIPKNTVYFKKIPNTRVQIYSILSRLILGDIEVSEARNGDDENSTFNYNELVEWVQTNTVSSGSITTPEGNTDVSALSKEVTQQSVAGYLNPLISFEDLSEVVTANGTSQQLTVGDGAGYRIIIVNLGPNTIWLRPVIANGDAAEANTPGSIPITPNSNYDTGKNQWLIQGLQLMVPVGGLYTAYKY